MYMVKPNIIRDPQTSKKVRMSNMSWIWETVKSEKGWNLKIKEQDHGPKEI